MRRMKKRRSDKMMVGFIAVMVISLGLCLELGRGYFAMQDVKRFSDNFKHLTPAGVKEEVRRFAKGLGDRNPLVRDASMTAMKLATGWRLGPEPKEWRQFWYEHEASWEYHSETSAPPADTKAPWADLIPTPAPK